MTERPILFSAPMVRALLAGTKTQTRRAIKLPHENPLGKWEPTTFGGPNGGRTRAGATIPEQGGIWHTRTGDSLGCPHGQPGDRLWVRETWTWNGGQGGPKAGEFAKLWVTYAADGQKREIAPGGVVPLPKQPPQRDGEVYSLRDATEDFRYDGENTYVDRLTRWWRRKIPAIHMFRWASRITLEITAVRVERLQEISEADAQAEGAQRFPDLPYGGQPDNRWSMELPSSTGQCLHTPRMAFANYLNKVNGEGTWDANPWVWVVEFKRLP